MKYIILGAICVALGILQIIRPVKIFTDRPEAQASFQPAKTSPSNIILSLVLIGIGLRLIAYALR